MARVGEEGLEWQVVGLAGMLLIVAGWSVALREPPPPPKLSLLYGTGSLLLTIYAAALHDPIFTALNALSTLLAAANLARSRLTPKVAGSEAKGNHRG